MTRHRSLRSQLYRDARIMGNVQAASHGPVSYARRKVYSKSNSLTRQLLRALSLSR